MQKKYFIIAIIFTVLLGFSAFLAGRASTGNSITELESRIADVTGKFETSNGIIEDLRTENERIIKIGKSLESENIGLRKEVGELRTINSRFKDLIAGINDTNSDIGTGIKEADSGMETVIEGIDYYIEKAGTQEDNYNQ